MEEAVNKVLNRNLELAQNVLSALKEARIKSSTDMPTWTVILSEAALLTSREFELPETRDIMDLDSEAKSFAWSLYYCFLESLTAVYKLYANLPVPLQNASVNSLEPYLSLLERHREDLEKTMLAEKEADIKPMAVISCNGRPLKILYVDSLAAFEPKLKQAPAIKQIPKLLVGDEITWEFYVEGYTEKSVSIAIKSLDARSLMLRDGFIVGGLSICRQSPYTKVGKVVLVRRADVVNGGHQIVYSNG